MTLKEIIAKINEAKKTINANPNDWDFRTRHGLLIKQNQAKTDLAKLEYDFQKELFDRTFKVALVGQTNKEQVIAALKNNNSFIISAKSLYNEMASYVEPTIKYGGTFHSAAYIKLVDTAAGFGRKFGIGQKLMKEPLNPGIKDFDSLVDIVKKTVKEGYGDELNKSYILTHFYETALKQSFDKEIAILVICDLDNEELNGLATKLLPSQSLNIVNLEEEAQTKPRALATKTTYKAFEHFRKLGKIEKEESNKEE